MTEHTEDQADQAPGQHSERPGYGVTGKFPVPEEPAAAPEQDEDPEDDE